MIIRQLILLLILIAPWYMAGQIDSVDVDTLIDTEQIETKSQDKKENIFTIFSGKPGKATLYSLILPGAGQLYNKRWWKVPLVYALEGTAVYFVIQNRNTFKQFDKCYRSIVNNATDPRFCQNITRDSDAFSIRNSARSNMELSWLFLIGAHVLQTLEAFIDRHLIDFDTDENLSIGRPKFNHDQYNPNLSNEISIISLTYNFGK